MAEDTCRMPHCDNDRRPDVAGRSGRFCSPRCEVKYDHLKADARDARAEIEAEAKMDRRRERHFDRNGHF